MGVESLWNLLSRVGKKCELSELGNKRLAVDASVWLMQMVRGMRNEDGSVMEDAHLKGIFSRLLKLLYYGIKPVFVFDGGKPQLKADTMVARAANKKKMEEKAALTAREILVTKVKQKMLSVVKDGKKLSETELRKLLQTVDEVAELNQERDERTPKNVPVILKKTKLEPTVIPPQLVERMKAKEQFDEKLKDYEMAIDQLPVNESGLFFSNLQVSNLVNNLRQKKPVIQKIQSDPQREFVFVKNDKDLEELKKNKNLPKELELIVSFNDTAKDEFENEEFEGSDENALVIVKEKIEQNEFEDEEFESFEQQPCNNNNSNTDNEGGYIVEEEEQQEEFVVEEEHKNNNDKNQNNNNNNNFNNNINNYGEQGIIIQSKETDHNIKGRGFSSVEKEEKEENNEGGFFVDFNYQVEDEKKEVDDDGDGFIDFHEESGESNNHEMEVEQKKRKVEENEEDIVTKRVSDDEIISDEGNNESEEENDVDSDFPSSLEEKDNYSSEEDTQQKWTCSLCTWKNGVSAKSCDMCDNPRSVRLFKKPEQNDNVIVSESHARSFIPVGKEDEFVEIEEEALEELSVNELLSRLKGELNEEEEKLQKQENAENRMLEGYDLETIEEVKQVLSLFGIPYVQAPMEAEAQCAYLEMLKLVDGTITEDSDVLLVGSRMVYKNFFRSHNHPMSYSAEDVRGGLGLTRIELIQLAYLLGSDYTLGVKRVGIVTAMEILCEFKETQKSETEIDQCLRPLIAFREWFNDKESKKLLGLRKKLNKVEIPASFPRKEVALGYLFPEVDKSEEEFVWNAPDFDRLRHYATMRLKWSPERCEGLLDPIRERLNELREFGKISQQKTLIEFFTVHANQEHDQYFDSKRLTKAVCKMKGEKYVETRVKKKIEEKDEYREFLYQTANDLAKENEDLTLGDVFDQAKEQWEAKVEQSHSLQPPFLKTTLKTMKMNKLRMLCVKYGLKPSILKRDVIDQLCMLTEQHVPLDDEQFDKKITKRQKVEKTKDEQILLEKMLEQWNGDSSKQEECKISINRAPVLCLWITIVCLKSHQFEWKTSITIARSIVSIFANSKASKLGLYQNNNNASIKDFHTITVLGQQVPVCTDGDGCLVGVDLDTEKPFDTESASRYLLHSFGDAFGLVKASMEELAVSYGEELDGVGYEVEGKSKAYALYEQFRPSVAGDIEGWGQKGVLDLGVLKQLCKRE